MRVVVSLLVLWAGPACAASANVAGDQLILSGKLDDSELAQFRDAATAHGKAITTVILRDLRPAGTLLESARMAADYVRDQGWRTAVSGECTGACAIIFLGGVSRHFTDDKPPGNTRVGLSGWHFTVNTLVRGYGKNEFSPMAASKARQWIQESTQGKISDPAHTKVIACDKLEADVYREGIVTSSELIRSNDLPAR